MSYRVLNATKIIKTIGNLHQRITERFPESGLANVCMELLQLCNESRKRCEWIDRPLIGLRIGIGVVITIILAVAVEAILVGKFGESDLQLTNFVNLLEAILNTSVLIGASILFLVTVETRIKRHRAIKAINELRTLAQVIDMHQLPKNPDRFGKGWKSTEHSPKETLTPFELSRYLDYCSEMVSLCGKVAALYGQSLQDDVVLSAVTDIESMTTGLSRKIWQKINLLKQSGDF